ncbi:dihydrodipicolinate synthase family protein [uncultured Sphaerochaeta sp.]|uniref:dihydrodipicolinate synthase family protein n=1 Tax=uncultured Sphaerochaeta sp. TaxID=886478 RepID=UPI002A0A3C35|nr:dihydrodipicolinate synthase family protein [uncultured Sphaerochaeta sp.]
MDTNFFKGIIVPIVTPVSNDETIDEKKLRHQVDFVIDGGVSGILVFGSNGEFYMMEEAEIEQTLTIVLDHVKNRVPVYLGIGNIRTSKCVRLAKMAEHKGVKGISLLQPMFLKPSEDELRTHFATIAQSVPSLPVLLYNNPGRTGYGISQDCVQYLAHSVPNIVGMKDSSGDLTQTSEFIRRNNDIGFKVMCGKDTLIYAGLCVGAVGAVCSTANFLPELVCSIYDLFVAGNMKGSLQAQWKLDPIRLQMDKSSFPVATKDYANLIGAPVGDPILPSKCSTIAQLEGLRAQLVDAGYLQ